MKRLLLLLVLCMSLSYITSAQSIPNRDFENWSSAVIYSQPDSGWYSSNPNCIAALDTVNVTKIAGASGNAVKLHTITKTVATGIVDTQVAYIANTPFMPLTRKGGMPYSGQLPEYLNVTFMASVATYDTAFILVIFKQAGSLIGYNEFRIWGNTWASAWKDSSFQLALVSIPDTVIIAAASSNLISHVDMNPASWLAIDNMYFVTSGAPVQLPGATFDSFASPSIVLPTGWSENGNGFAYEGTTQTTTAEHGSYAIQLVTEASGGSGGGMGPAAMNVTSGYFTQDNGPAGGLAYSYTGADTLSGYFEYSPGGIDTGFATVTLEEASSVVVPGFPQTFAFTSASGYTPFKLGWGTPAQPPATMRIDFTSSSSYAPVAGSTLRVDNLSLKSQSVGVKNVNLAFNNVISYPNPANDVLNISLGQAPAGSINVKIYDLSGRTLSGTEFSSNSVLHVPVSQLPTGMYFYEVSADGTTVHNKFIKQ